MMHKSYKEVMRSQDGMKSMHLAAAVVAVLVIFSVGTFVLLMNIAAPELGSTAPPSAGGGHVQITIVPRNDSNSTNLEPKDTAPATPTGLK